MNNDVCFNLTCLVGVTLSVYALMVEVKKEHDVDYEAMCDISEHMSCSKVLTSRWSRGFGLLEIALGEDSIFNQPNSLFGIFFYTSLAVSNLNSSLFMAKIRVAASVLSNLASLYLGSVLLFVLEDFCVVCVATYAVNALLLVFSIRKYNLIYRYPTISRRTKVIPKEN